MKKQVNISELSKEMEHFGLQVNEKGEILTMDGEKKIKIGHARPTTEEEKMRAEKIDCSMGIKRKIK